MSIWYNYYSQKVLTLPEVSEIILVQYEGTWIEGKVLEITHNGNYPILVVRVFDRPNSGVGSLRYFDDSNIKPLDYDKIAKRNKTVNTALYIFAEGLGDVKGLEKLYDAGMLRLPDNI